MNLNGFEGQFFCFKRERERKKYYKSCGDFFYLYNDSLKTIRSPDLKKNKDTTASPQKDIINRNVNDLKLIKINQFA